MSADTTATVTAKDVARELNLSQPTVSRILSGHRGQRASEDTRRRVWEAAERLGYQPNAVARSLRQGRTNVIGVHTSHNYDVRNRFWGTIVGALQCACGEHDLDVMLHNAQHGPRGEAMFGKLRDGRIDGVILRSSMDDPLVPKLASSALPVVAIADPLPGVTSVTCDDAGGLQLLVDFLWERGYRNFAFLAPHIWLPSVEHRQQAFEAELEKRGVAPEARRVITIQFEEAAPAIDELQAHGSVAACCWNDRTAYSLLKACSERGVEVPQEIAVAGFDGFLDDEQPARRLVTVKCPWEDVASAALNRLLNLIELRQQKRASPPGEEIRLPVTILDGDTV